MTSSVKDNTKIAKLTDHTNWHLWKFKMTILLKGKELWHVVEAEGTEVNADNQKVDHKAQALIAMNVTDTILVSIMNATTARQMWQTLTDTYESAGFNDERALMGDLRRLKLTADDTISDYANKLTLITQRLATIGCAMKPRQVVQHLLMGLPHDWSPTIQALTARQGELTWGDALRALLDEETRRRESMKELFMDSAQLARTSPRKKMSSDKKKEYLRTGRCFNCSGYGHRASECPTPTDYDYDKEDSDDGQEAAALAVAASSDDGSDSFLF